MRNPFGGAGKKMRGYLHVLRGNHAVNCPLFLYFLFAAELLVAQTTSNVAAGPITADAATITWTTSRRSNSKLDYGCTTSYSLNRSSSDRVLLHTIVLNNLASNTLYHYRVRSGSHRSKRRAFRTLAPASSPTPVSAPSPSPPPDLIPKPDQALAKDVKLRTCSTDSSQHCFNSDFSRYFYARNFLRNFDLRHGLADVPVVSPSQSHRRSRWYKFRRSSDLASQIWSPGALHS